jgi:hypothetical protein
MGYTTSIKGKKALQARPTVKRMFSINNTPRRCAQNRSLARLLVSFSSGTVIPFAAEDGHAPDCPTLRICDSFLSKRRH